MRKPNRVPDAHVRGKLIGKSVRAQENTRTSVTFGAKGVGEVYVKSAQSLRRHIHTGAIYTQP